MSTKQSTTPARKKAAKLELVFDQKRPTALHLDAQCPHGTPAEKAGQPGYSKVATTFRKATADELKSLKLCGSCAAKAEKLAAVAEAEEPKAQPKRQPIARNEGAPTQGEPQTVAA